MENDATTACLVECERMGRNRLSRLSPPERDLYRWILRSFPRHGRPPVDGLVDRASSLGLDVEAALARLAEEDLVHHDPRTGDITVAYPFSGEPTSHVVRLDGGRDVYAMCAVDALGVPFMLGETAEILSLDPLTEEEVSVRVDPGSVLEWRPESAVVFWGATGGEGPSAATCCRFVHFFSSEETTRRYLADRPQLAGQIVPVQEAARAGRLIFGDLLAPDD